MARVLNERELSALGFSRPLIAALRQINEAVGTGSIDLGQLESMLFVTQALGNARAELSRLRIELESVQAEIRSARNTLTNMNQFIGEITVQAGTQRRPDTFAKIEQRLQLLEANTFCP